jgi:hypothetical protein
MAKAEAQRGPKRAVDPGRATTTIRIRVSTKRIIERMVQAEGSTCDEVIARIARHECQRMIGAELAQRQLTSHDEAVVRAGADTVARSGR